MNILVYDDYEEMSHAAADTIVGQLKFKPGSLLCAATGGTPTRMYEYLVGAGAESPDLFKKLKVIKLDEWGGVPMDDPCTCEVYLQEKLIRPLHLQYRYVAFKSDPDDVPGDVGRIGAWMEQNGPLDICILGLGANGHLGFNEPADELQPFAHIAELSETSMGHDMTKKAGAAITHGVTLGMNDIMGAKTVILLVNGEHKREQFARLMEKKITPRFPASMLWAHRNVMCFCDRAVAEGLT